MRDVMKEEAYKDLELLEIAYGNDQFQTAYDQTKALIQNYPDLMIAWDVPYDSMGSAVALQKGSNLLPAVNAVINNCLVDGSMDKYVAEANELASGKVYEGQLDENGEMMTEASTE